MPAQKKHYNKRWLEQRWDAKVAGTIGAHPAETAAEKKEGAAVKPSMGIAECCQIMRDNNISVSEPIFTGMIQAGSFPAWAVPSIDTKSAAPLISRAGFMAWMKDFYKLEKIYTKEDPKE